MFRVEKTEANLNKCLCPGCPSYNDCAKEKAEALYCAGEVGKSECPFQMNGCLCGGCPVHMENNLTAGYFCINGSADEIEGKMSM